MAIRTHPAHDDLVLAVRCCSHHMKTSRPLSCGRKRACLDIRRPPRDQLRRSVTRRVEAPYFPSILLGQFHISRHIHSPTAAVTTGLQLRRTPLVLVASILQASQCTARASRLLSWCLGLLCLLHKRRVVRSNLRRACAPHRAPPATESNRDTGVHWYNEYAITTRSTV